MYTARTSRQRSSNQSVGATHQNAQLGLQDNGSATNVLVVCKSWGVSAFVPAKQSGPKLFSTVFWGMNPMRLFITLHGALLSLS